MRILQIGLSKNMGGIETVIMSFFRELSKCGILFDFVDIYGEGLAYAEEIKDLGGKIYSLENYKRHPFKVKKELIKIVTEGNYKCVHLNMLSAANLIPLKSVKKTNAYPIVHCHNNATEGLLRKGLHRINISSLRKSSAIKLACSKSAGEWMFGNEEFYILENAIDFSKFKFDKTLRDDTRREFNFNEDSFVMGFVGRLSYQKNPQYLIKILAELNKLNHNAKLLIVGDGELKNQIINYAEAQGVKEHVVFAGMQKDLKAFYSAMDCFLLPSVYEGLGIVVIEAQVNGLNCFVSNNVPQEAVVTNRIYFLPITNEGVVEWVKLIQEKERINRRDEIIIENVNFDIQVAAKKLKKIYEYIENKGEQL